MNKKAIQVIVLINILLLMAVSSWAQKPTVSFDYAKENFNENQPLPAETYFMVTSPISKQVMGVGIQIHRGKESGKKAALYEGFWKRAGGNADEVFYLPVNYKLRGNDEYDFTIQYYRKVTEKEQVEVAKILYQLIDAYIDQAFDGGKKLELLKNTQQTIDDLNSVVNTALSRYKNLSGLEFAGFSDLVKTKVGQMEGIKFNKKDSLGYEMQRTETLAELSKLIQLETSFVNTSDWVVVADSKTIDNYPVERTQNILTLQVGYGGTYLDGKVDDLSYAAAPKAGFVFPLGNAAFASRFWSKSAIVAGVYLTDFEDADNNKISGPIFKRPIYAGLGYNVFRFVRVNAGVSVLEGATTAGSGGVSGLDSRVFVRPFVSITADLRLWIDLAK